MALLGATCLLMGRVEGFVGLAVGFTSLRLMVQGPLTLTGTTLVAQWFEHAARGDAAVDEAVVVRTAVERHAVGLEAEVTEVVSRTCSTLPEPSGPTGLPGAALPSPS